MTTWRLRLRPRTPWGTPWRSDSLFGSVCWQWLELYPDTFGQMLDEFRAGECPPYLLSDAWPGDYLPIPAHVILPPADKKRNPPLYVSQASFRSLMCGEAAINCTVMMNLIRSSSRVQTSIDRDLGSAAEGQLFETDTQYLDKSCDLLSVYVRSGHYLDKVEACFKALAWKGFGKKSSTGLGDFEIAGPPELCEWLDDVPGANAWTALNHFVPAPSDPVDGVWRTHVTFPKFHANTVSNVFKGSLLMLAPGSVFRTGQRPPRPWYGSMIPMPRPEMPNALHYGLCLAVPLIWQPEER